MTDMEMHALVCEDLTNATVNDLSWEGVTVSVKQRKSTEPKLILSNINGTIRAGELFALMGPSGSGKTTLLNVLAHRHAAANASIQRSLYLNGTHCSTQKFRQISSYVEQEDALLGALTVKETLSFAAKLSLGNSVSKGERIRRIESLLVSFGLKGQENTLVGTPIRKGISGGQKRRLGVAGALITSPKILFLDEPTSGLDSTASFEVISFIRNVAKEHGLLVIASIHQPSTATFELFDKLLLLSQGRTAYNGPISEVRPYFESMGYPMPLYVNPAEFVIDLVNVDFHDAHRVGDAGLAGLLTAWERTEKSTAVTSAEAYAPVDDETTSRSDNGQHITNLFKVTFVLIHRSFIKSSRDVLTYGVRVAMYLGLAIMMGTVWLRLGLTQENIQSFINAIFFGGAFMSFMAVAYIPAYLEDRALYIKERANGLYGPTAFIIANFVTGAPFLFTIVVLFSLPAYFLTGFNPTGTAFFRWILYLFLDLLCAESLVVLLSSLTPIFVVALALTAFANGLWMCVGGFLVPKDQLNVFWRYVFHYIDYQGYVFEGMMTNEFYGRSYACGAGCRCLYPSALESQCRIDGAAVLDAYGYHSDRIGTVVGILVGIMVVYRLLGWAVLYVRRT